MDFNLFSIKLNTFGNHGYWMIPKFGNRSVCSFLFAAVSGKHDLFSRLSANFNEVLLQQNLCLNLPQPFPNIEVPPQSNIIISRIPKSWVCKLCLGLVMVREVIATIVAPTPRMPNISYIYLHFLFLSFKSQSIYMRDIFISGCGRNYENHQIRNQNGL